MGRKSKGFTLLEIIVTLAILTVAISLAAQLITFSMKGQKKANEEYDFQSQMRLTSQTLNNEIRKSTVLFAVPQNVFESKKNEWNYIGLKDSKTLVSYTWNPTNNTHDEKILIKSEEDNSFNLLFKKNNKDSKLIEFNLQGYIDGAPDAKMNIKTELEAMNSLVVEDGGTDTNPATAIAYRTEATPQPETTEGKKVIAAITLVLDKSGSMKDLMNASGGGKKQKISILNSEVKELLADFAGKKNVIVNIVPFSDTAPKPANSYTQSSILKSGFYFADTFTYTDLSQGGGTNTGDALRQAFYTLENLADKKADQPTFALNGVMLKDLKIVNNIILLTDGDPTMWTQKAWYNSSFVTQDTYDGYEVYNESSSRPMEYVEEISEMITSYQADSESAINSYIIGFGTTTAQNTRLNKINGYLTRSGVVPKPVYTAENQVELEDAFDEISQTILNEIWHIYGPY